jgi:hypothetical protein
LGATAAGTTEDAGFTAGFAEAAGGDSSLLWFWQPSTDVDAIAATISHSARFMGRQQIMSTSWSQVQSRAGF